MPFNFSRPDDDATLRSLLKQAAWVAALDNLPQDPLPSLLGFSPSLKEVLALVTASEHELSASDGCGLYLLDEEKGGMLLAAHTLDERCGAFPRLDPRRGFWAQALAAQGSQTVSCVEVCPIEVRSDITDRCGMQKVLAAPLRAGQHTLGLLVSFGRSPSQWSQGAGPALAQLARVGGAALAQALAREVRENQAREEETAKLVETVVGRLMEENKIEQREALRIIQKQSMNTRQSRRRVAATLALVHGIRKESLAVA